MGYGQSSPTVQAIYMVRNKLLQSQLYVHIEESWLSARYSAICIILHIKRTIPVTVYHLLPWILEHTMAEIEVLTPGGNQDAAKMSSVKNCLAYVQAIFWSASAQISIVHL